MSRENAAYQEVKTEVLVIGSEAAGAKAAIEADRQKRLTAAAQDLARVINEWGKRHRARIILRMAAAEVAPGVWGMRPEQGVILEE